MSLETRTNVADLLSTDNWYPVMSPLRIKGNHESSFWISDKPEEFMTPLDQSEAQCYRVDFKPENYSPDGASAIGRVAALSPEARIQLLIVGDYAYLGNRDVVTAKREKEKHRKQEHEEGRLQF